MLITWILLICWWFDLFRVVRAFVRYSLIPNLLHSVRKWPRLAMIYTNVFWWVTLPTCHAWPIQTPARKLPMCITCVHAHWTPVQCTGETCSRRFSRILGRVILSSVYSGKPSTVCDKTEFMLTVLMKGWDQDGGDGGRLYDIRCKVN